ncbi:MAG: TonB C-terminal domain-containing protein [Gemmatimonadetes bacterium]|nr:TonB C-terminal domain-containing protein [Gemmatimonadota bacterium]
MRNRRKTRPGKLAVGASAVLHLAAFLLLWWSRDAFSTMPDFVVYELMLVEPPPAEAAEEVSVPAPPERTVVDRPEPTPQTEAPPPPRRTEAPPRADTRTAERQPEREEPPERPRGPNPQPEAREAGSGLNVRLEGLRTDYPEYFQNIVRQLTRYFRWRDQGNWEAEVAFVIRKDGEVREIQWVRRSGNILFDLEAMGAVEKAGSDRAFGPLPAGFPADFLAVSFYFSPSGSR